MHHNTTAEEWDELCIWSQGAEDWEREQELEHERIMDADEDRLEEMDRPYPEYGTNPATL